MKEFHSLEWEGEMRETLEVKVGEKKKARSKKEVLILRSLVADMGSWNVQKVSKIFESNKNLTN